MRAVLLEAFGAPPQLREVPDPPCADDGVVVRVEATGLCRSDWHGWLGHDPDIRLPHVPGHELAGTIVEAGAEVTRFAVGDRVTVPFVCGCGRCSECVSGNPQTCRNQQQPGFTYWGSFAELVALPWADLNLVRVPDTVDLPTAASLGCRFATAYRGVRQVAQVQPGETVAVFGCGGVGLAAVMIAAAAGAHVIAVDPSSAARALAAEFGARTVLDPDGIAEAVRELTYGGADVAVEALGAAGVVGPALASLRPRGRLVQIGLLPGEVTLDLSSVVSRELRWLGSHGIATATYPALLDEIGSGLLDPSRLITRHISLDETPDALAAMSHPGPAGITVIHPHQR
ncbi:zinc-binding dehydrogenase [Jatrophihabitans telluris]|uniref:zinc-binding dehydrogenase n=1 Tax=Jatrophihabitans telluris TaxID=2038343 RepID=UPI003221FBBC